MGVVATAVMVFGGFTDPERRYIYLLFIFLGLIFTFRAFRDWEERRAGGP